MATFTNMATLSYSGNTVYSNIVTGEVRDTLTIAKTAVRDTYTGGDDITYVVTVSNTGTTPYTGLVLADNLGAYTVGTALVYPLTYVPGAIRYFINGELQAVPVVSQFSALVIQGITVPVGGTATVIYEVTVNEYAPMAVGSIITNTVTLSGPGIPAPLTAQETVHVRNEAAVTITKSLFPTAVTENGQVTYTFTIQNHGNTAITAADDTVLADIFEPALAIQSVSFNGTPWALGANYTYDQITGEFSTLEGQITVPAATYTQNAAGVVMTEPGVSTLTVTGTI